MGKKYMRRTQCAGCGEFLVGPAQAEPPFVCGPECVPLVEHGVLEELRAYNKQVGNYGTTVITHTPLGKMPPKPKVEEVPPPEVGFRAEPMFFDDDTVEEG